jgi:hypothetical protein
MSSPTTIRRLRTALGRIRFRAYLPHTTFPHALAKGISISDHFLYRADIAAIRFVAETTLALLLAAVCPRRQGDPCPLAGAG